MMRRTEHLWRSEKPCIEGWAYGRVTIVKGVAPRICVKHGLGCGWRLDLEVGLWPRKLSRIEKGSLGQVEFCEAHARAGDRSGVKGILVLKVGTHGRSGRIRESGRRSGSHSGVVVVVERE